MAVLLLWGVFQAVKGSLGLAPAHAGQLPVGVGGDGVLMGASLFVVLHAFASGGAAVTGVEAIADGVSAFKVPEWKNASKTLVAMGRTLGVLFFGLSFLASRTHVVPFEQSTDGTVISQVGRAVFGSGAVGSALFYSLQLGTALILILAANTSFADFPRLANFAAEDAFLPRWLTRRGHRLVFSNGIIFLAVMAVVVVVLTGARVEHLIPLYAVVSSRHSRSAKPAWRSTTSGSAPRVGARASL
jgi:amino acid transporter